MPYYRWHLKTSRPNQYPKQLKTLADHLKARRLDLGVTQWAIARQLGVDPGSVRNWETGRTSIELRYYPTLIGLLGYNPLPQPTSLGKAIQRARMTRGLSRKRLAVLAGLDEATVRRMEDDTPRMARRSVKAVREILELPDS